MPSAAQDITVIEEALLVDTMEAQSSAKNSQQTDEF